MPLPATAARPLVLSALVLIALRVGIVFISVSWWRQALPEMN